MSHSKIKGDLGQLSVRVDTPHESEATLAQPEDLEMHDAVSGAEHMLARMAPGLGVIDRGEAAVHDPRLAAAQAASQSTSQTAIWNDLIQRVKDFDSTPIVKALDAVAEVIAFFFLR